MQHTIPVEKLGPAGTSMADAVEKCVHCGFCLPTCPTYTVLSEEMDSPRGRIILMKSVLEGDVELEDALPYLDRCLGCLACVTACPSGVPYGEMITPFKAYANEHRRRPVVDRAARRLALETLPYPDRFRASALSGRLAKPLQGLLPEQLQAMLALLPESLPEAQPLPAVFPAQGERRARVALLAGCVQQVLAPEINWATLHVLARNGVEVIIPEAQGCCGALALHAGEMDLARTQALNNIDIFPRDVDAIITNAAGCGSGMKEYSLLFKGTEWEDQGVEFSSHVEDVSIFLDRLGIIEIPPLPESIQLAYHDACHLAHAQGVRLAPRRLLERIPGVNLVPVSEEELCCGSAGTYNFEQPETAHALGQRKAKHILECGAQAVATGNIGCMVQLRAQLAELGRDIPVWHTIEVLDRAYRGWV
jgi:glycolate oxidase iron-sulfur subunit